MGGSDHFFGGYACTRRFVDSTPSGISRLLNHPEPTGICEMSEVVRAALLCLYLVSAAALASAGEPETYGVVRSAPAFAIGGIGVAGTISKEEIAMRQLRSEPNAQEQLRKLLTEATPAGRMYALFALRQLDAADYDQLSKPYRADKTAVKRIQGCIISTAPTEQIIQWIDRYAKEMKGWEKH